MTPVDLEPAAQRLADLVRGVRDEMLDAPTPCPAYTVGDLLDHLGGTAIAFTGAAKKDLGDATSQGPSGDASRLGDDWRRRIPRALTGLGEAWRDPTAWTGMTRAGGIELPGEVAGLVALDELAVHGWDIARATGQTYESDPVSLEAVHDFVEQFADPAQEEVRKDLFGPVVHVPEEAPLIDRVIGLTGRDPAWSPR
jgi:uncharacterized protein (TIGR03086 family)